MIDRSICKQFNGICQVSLEKGACENDFCQPGGFPSHWLEGNTKSSLLWIEHKDCSSHCSIPVEAGGTFGVGIQKGATTKKVAGLFLASLGEKEEWS